MLVRGYVGHSPWITAHDVESLGGQPVTQVVEASAAIKAMVDGISPQAVLNQGLIESRERSTAVQALTLLRDHGHGLVPEQLVVEAIRQGWPVTSSIELGALAEQLSAGKRLRYEKRLNPAAVVEWASA